MAAFHQPGESLSRAQQASMYYARKRRRARASLTPAVLGRERSYLGLEILVVLEAV